MTKRKRIYLSVSKVSNKDKVKEIVANLKTLENVEVVQFEGGTYSTDKLDSCDVLLFIPPNLPDNDSAHRCIGKGQFIEITRAFDTNKDVYCVYDCTSTYSDEVVMMEAILPSNLSTLDENWTDKYCEIDLNPYCTISIEKQLDVKYSQQEQSTWSVEDPKYVNVTTQEEWDTVITKLRPIGNRYNSFSCNKKQTIINIKHGCYGNYKQVCESEIISFNEWNTRFNPDNPKPTKQQEVVIKIGEECVIEQPIQQSTISINLLICTTIK